MAADVWYMVPPDVDYVPLACTHWGMFSSLSQQKFPLSMFSFVLGCPNCSSVLGAGGASRVHGHSGESHQMDGWISPSAPVSPQWQVRGVSLYHVLGV